MKPNENRYFLPKFTFKLIVPVVLGTLAVAMFLLLSVISSYAATPTILTISPSSAPNNFDATIVITGADFQVEMSGTTVLTVPIVRLGEYELALADQITTRTITATVPWGLEAGVYQIQIMNSDGTGVTLSNAFTVTAALNVWSTGGPYGGSVPHLEMDVNNTDKVYAQLGDMGLFKSVDAGNTWNNVFPGYLLAHIGMFRLKPGNPDTIFLSGSLGEGDYLYRSTNGGVDWTSILTGRWRIAVTPANPDMIYVGNDGIDKIKRSTNNGDSWQTVNNGIPLDASVEFLAIHPITPTIVYAGLDGGRVYKTIDGGSNWAATPANFGDGWWSVLQLDPHAPERIYASGWHIGSFFARSLDGGMSWETMSVGPVDNLAMDVDFHPIVSGTMYAQTGYGMYHSVDGGTTWNGPIPIAPEHHEINAIVLHPQTGVPLYAGHNGKAVLRSDDAIIADGIVWEVRNQGLTGINPHEIAPSAADPRYIYLGGDDAGGFVSNNGGQSWQAIVGPDRGISVAADPYSATVAYLGARRSIYKTTDGGQTWVESELPGLPQENEMRVHAIAIDPHDPQVVYAGPGTWDFVNGVEFGWLYRSQDAGLTWNPITLTFPISAVTDIVIDPSDSDIIYVSTGRRFSDTTDRGTGIIKTTDGGNTWQFINQGLLSLNVSRLAINPEHPQILYAGGNPADDASSSIYKTVDGGDHWTQLINNVHISGLEIHPVLTDTLYAGAYTDGLYHSTDAGTTWQKVNGPLGYLNSLSLNLTMVQSRTLIYAGVAGGLLNVNSNAGLGNMPSSANSPQFFGSGVYQYTIDLRQIPRTIYLPMIVKD